MTKAGKTCYGPKTASPYSGNLSFSKNGFKSLNWNDGYDNVLNEEHNYCRNPLGDSYSRSGRPWCYVSEVDSSKGYRVILRKSHGIDQNWPEMT